MTFYGLLHLSRELENPYGQDFNDIDLARYQDDLHEDSACRGLWLFKVGIVSDCVRRGHHDARRGPIVVCGLQGALSASPEPTESLY